MTPSTSEPGPARYRSGSSTAETTAKPPSEPTSERSPTSIPEDGPWTDRLDRWDLAAYLGMTAVGAGTLAAFLAHLLDLLGAPAPGWSVLVPIGALSFAGLASVLLGLEGARKAGGLLGTASGVGLVLLGTTITGLLVLFGGVTLLVSGAPAGPSGLLRRALAPEP